ncbi:MAG: PTS sugar transporter subunit IIA [Verrucomicrobia bacterium]|nr:PTS sugar transporter subunit IIA [Verrucomicrobiota bacterium]
MTEVSIPRFELGSLISPETIELDLKGANSDEVLQELIEKVPAIADEPESKKRLLRALREREKLCSTGVGDGVAFPHCRNALIGLVQKPVIVFGRHSQGVPYGAVDNEPAKLFFLLVAPTVSQHLQVLARLGRLLRNPRLRKELLIAERPERVIQLLGDAERG